MSLAASLIHTLSRPWDLNINSERFQFHPHCIRLTNLTGFRFNLSPYTDKNNPEQLRESFSLSLMCHLKGIFSFFPRILSCFSAHVLFLCSAQGSLVPVEKGRGKLPFLSLSRHLFFFFFGLTEEHSYAFFFIVNNAFSLHAHPGLTLYWKHFMKMWSCLKFKLISKLKSLGLLYQPHPFSPILFDMQAVFHWADWNCINFLRQSLFFFSIFPTQNFIKCTITGFLAPDNHSVIIYPWCLSGRRLLRERDGEGDGGGRVEKVADWLGYLFWFHAAVWSDIHLRGRYLKNARESLKLPGVASFSRICFLKIPLARLCLLLHAPIPPPRIPPTDISPPFGRITHNFPSKYAYPPPPKKPQNTHIPAKLRL